MFAICFSAPPTDHAGATMLLATMLSFAAAVLANNIATNIKADNIATNMKADNIAITGTNMKGDSINPALEAMLKTKWTLVPAANATAADIAAATVFVQAPLDMLPKATHGSVYQFIYTGIESELSYVPAKFTVTNTHQDSIPIAEYVLASVLEWTVKLRQMDAALRACTWRAAAPGNQCSRARIEHKELHNSTIGILGYGHIGEAIATRAAAFGTRLIATTIDPPAVPPPPLSWIGDDKSNSRLFEESDFVIVCMPLVNSTRGLVDAALLSHLGPHGVLVNIARGPIVKEEDLYAALSRKAIGGAVLDVWWHDIFRLPSGGVGPDNWPSQFRFDKLDNVIMSAHTSGNTEEGHHEALKEAAANLDRMARGQPPHNVVRNGTKIQEFAPHGRVVNS